MNAVVPTERRSLVQKFASKYSIEANRLMATLKATAFRQRDNAPEVTDEQMAALLIVADQYGLNPFTREIYAFPDKGGIVPVVGVDGWSRIINEHPQCDGFEFVASDEMTTHGGKEAPKWMDVVIYRKDRSHPTKVREYFAEVVRDTQPWKSHPSRMLRHKTLIQGARVAFGFAGIFDEDEAQRIIEHDVTPTSTTPSEPPKKGVAGLRAALAKPEEPAMQIPTGIAFNTLLADMEKAQSADVADLVLDQARELSEEERAQLRAAYDAKFGVKE